MKLLSLKNKYYSLKERKIYKKLKKFNLPYPFYDEKRLTFEWGCYDKNSNRYIVDNSINNLLPQGTLCYHYKINNNLVHSHTFEGLLKDLYNYPCTFSIPDEYFDEYSNQELNYIKENQNYLKLISLTDIKQDDKLYLERYNNIKHEKYKNCFSKHLSNEIIDAIIKCQKTNMVFRKYSFSSSMVGIKYLLIDEDFNFRCLIEIVSDNYIKFKDLKENMVYVSSEYKNFLEYVKDLNKQFTQDSKIYNEKFDDDSFINCVHFEVIEKFK